MEQKQGEGVQTEPETVKEDQIDEDMDKFSQWMVNFRDNLPYNKTRYLMIVGFTMLVLLVVYLGYAYGGLKMCTQVGGILDSDYICQLKSTSQSLKDSVGQPFILPNITIGERGLS